MPPRRKCDGATSKGRGGKKAKILESNDEVKLSPNPGIKSGCKGGRKAKPNVAEPELETDGPSSTKQIIEKLKKSDDKKKMAKVDQYCTRFARTNATVLDDYDCMLNQTNIGQNNNKYYVIQIIDNLSGSYFTWNRWGRVGEPGANALKGPMGKDKAIKDFEKKFFDKTGNHWSNREQFTAVQSKYTLIEMGDDEEVNGNHSSAQVPTSEMAQMTLPCTLDKPTQELIKLIFCNDMFQEAMKNLEIDVKKMPLGKISKSQIAKGFEALEKINDALKNDKTQLLMQLSSEFYTLIPHNFGRQRPPTISDNEMLQKKMDLLTVLGDIEVAQAIQKDDKQSEAKSVTGMAPHHLDYQYGLLQCDLRHLDKNSETFKILETYLEATKSKQLTILDIWEVNRHSEGKRFTANDKIENRKLLWHGTNIAVVVAILKSGLRIMPHSGGRVGRGIYFASENGKSAAYVCPASSGIGIMFLNEVALGREHHITCDDSSLVAPPKGFDSIVARGRREPDPKLDTRITIEEHKVIIPQGKPVPQAQFTNSNFSQSEYLIYQENQCRIRYILKLKFY